MLKNIVIGVLAAVLALGAAQYETKDETFQKGATSGAHDLCQEIGGTWSNEGWPHCD